MDISTLERANFGFFFAHSAVELARCSARRSVIRSRLSTFEMATNRRQSIHPNFLELRAKSRLPESVGSAGGACSKGNPVRTLKNGRIISQDLANSVLDFYSMAEAFNPARGRGLLPSAAGSGLFFRIDVVHWRETRFQRTDFFCGDIGSHKSIGIGANISVGLRNDEVAGARYATNPSRDFSPPLTMRNTRKVSSR